MAVNMEKNMNGSEMFRKHVDLCLTLLSDRALVFLHVAFVIDAVDSSRTRTASSGMCTGLSL